MTYGWSQKQYSAVLSSFEVYDSLVYAPEKHKGIGMIPKYWNRVITVGSAGKTFGVTGWRVGWLIGPHDLISYALAAHTRIVLCVNTPFQAAVSASFEQSAVTDFFRRQVEEYTLRYEKLAAVFRELCLPFTIPAGSYFILVNMDRVKIPSDFVFPEYISERGKCFQMCYWMCREIGVTAIPASEFYSPENAHLADDIVRFAFCKTDDVLDEAAKRLSGLKRFIV